MKIGKYIVVGLIVIAAVAATMSSLIVWHQPNTPNCIA